MAIRLGRGSSAVKVDADLEGFVRQAIDAVAGETARRFETDALTILSAARKDWPRKGDPRHPKATGRSKAALDGGLRLLDDGAVLEGYVICSAPYAKYIRTRRHGSVGTKLIRGPMNKASKAIVRDLGPDLVAAVKAKVGGR